jgi:hypothetical protein
MAHTIKISDGSTTCDFLGSNYKVLAEGWAPKVAKRRESVMGGQSPYEDVTETLEIQVSGTSESDVLSKLGTLSDLLDQAAKWGQNDAGVTAVYFEYEPDGSALAASVKAVIISPPPYGDFISLPRNFGIVYRNGRYYIGSRDNPIILSFVRRGLWLGATEAKAATASTGNPDIVTTSNFTDTPTIPVPYDMNIDFIGSVGSTNGSPGVYALTANAADKLYTIECEAMTGGSATVVAAASAGNVHRQADSGTATLTDSSFAMNTSARLFAFYIVVKPSAALTNWTITAKLYLSDTIVETVASSRPVVVGGFSTVKIIPLGIISTNWEPGRLVVTAVPDAVNSETLDLDYICGIALDESSNIFKTIPSDTAFDTGDQIKVEQQLSTKKMSKVTTLEADAVVAYLSYEGNANPYASGNSLSALIFGVTAASATFIIYDNDNTKEADITFTATRTMGYLTPL